MRGQVRQGVWVGDSVLAEGVGVNGGFTCVGALDTSSTSEGGLELRAR